MATNAALVASYTGLLTLATGIIYAGAWSSLPKLPRETPNLSGLPGVDDEDDEDDEDIAERLSSSDAYMFPIIGSAVLGGFFLIFKYFGKEWINWLLGFYFSIAGVGSIWKTFISLTRFCVGEKRWKEYDVVKLLVIKRTKELSRISLRTPSLVLLLPSMVPSLLYSTSWLFYRPAILSNILAVSFAHNALSLLKLDSFATGCILLTGLFVYDIWWVFGTTVMVSVATGLEVPIKLLWPKSTTFTTDFGFTMLGLGDVVIPGAFITLAMRYDLSCSSHRNRSMPFSKPYFTSALIAYVMGLVTTMVVMHTFKAAQPALLYLSPACIASFLLTATVRGELKKALAWQDEPIPKASIPKDLPTLEPALVNAVQEAAASVIASKSSDDFVNVESTKLGEDDVPSSGIDNTTEETTRKRKSKKGKKSQA